MEVVYIVLTESEGRHWDNERGMKVFAEESKAKEYLSAQFEEAKADIENISNKVEIEYHDSESYSIQGDDFNYWASGCISESKVN